MNDKQKAALAGKKMKTVFHLNMDDGGFLQQRCDELKLNRIVRTPKEKGRWGTGVVTWAVDGIDEEFETLDAAADAMERLGMIT